MNYKTTIKVASFFVLTVASLLVCAEAVIIECPASISAAQNIVGDEIKNFTVNPSSGLHDILGGELRKYHDEPSEKASIIFNSSGLRADEEVEEGRIYKERYTIDFDFFSKNKYKFYCMYHDTAVTLSVPMNPNYKECTVITIESDPANNKPKQVKMECLK
jgi:hypothetical protein